MRKNIIYILLLSVLGVCYTSCSTTRNLPADEVLYIGTESITFDGQKIKKKKKKSSEADSADAKGVILSLADAYYSIDELLSGKAGKSSASALAQLDQEQLKALRDSLKYVFGTETQAYATATEEVTAALGYPPNNALFGSYKWRFPLPMGLWMYNGFVNKKRKAGKWMFNTFAATPVYMSTVNPKVRVRVAQNLLRNYGFFRGTVSYEELPAKNPRKARLAYKVSPRELFRLDSVAYLRFPPVTDSLMLSTAHLSTLRRGEPFSVLNLDAERVRLSNLFRNNGFYYFKPDYITFRADTVMRPLHVQLQVLPIAGMPQEAQKRYYLGNTHIDLYKYDDFQLTDSIEWRGNKFRFVGNKKPPLRFGAIIRHLPYKYGEMYCQDLHEGIAGQVTGLGVFNQVNVRYVPRDTVATNDTLDVHISAVLDKPYDGEFEAKVTSKSNGFVGPGLSFGMSKRNAFRGAETLKLELHGAYEWQTGTQVKGKQSRINSYEYGASLSLDYPRIMAPWFGRRVSRRATTSTSFSLDASWLNRADYFGMVSLGARVGYTYQRKPTLKHEFVPFRLDYDELLHTSARFDSIMERNQALYVSMRNQFVPSMRYTLTYSSRPTARNPRSFIFEVKESGNLTAGIFAAAGQSFSRRDKEIFGVPFAQYVRLTAEFRDAFKLTARSRLATRIMAGAVFSYGNSSMAPYNDLFSVGGANSVRAFIVRGVGPGSYHPGKSDYSYIDQMGDLKFEANVEYRFPIVASLFGAVFLDAGNVWLREADPARPGGTFKWSRFGKDLALGTGCGLRYDLDFLVLRFDVGVGLHAPYDTGRKGYYNMPKFSESLGYHFAVGYPF